MASQTGAQTAIKVIHYAFPAVAFLSFIIGTIITVCTLQTQSLRAKDQSLRRGALIRALIGLTLTYVSQAVETLIKVVADSETKTLHNPTSQQDTTVYVLASCLIFTIQTLALVDTKFPVWYPYYISWFLAFVVEITLLIVANIIRHPETTFDFVTITIQSVRIIVLSILILLYFGLHNGQTQSRDVDAESQSLLRKELAPKHGSDGSSPAENGYGTTSQNGSQSDAADSDSASDSESEDSWLAEQRKAQEKIAQRLKQDGNWFTYAKGFSIFLPYVWPINNRTLQLRAALVGVCLLASNALNVLVPNQLGKMIDSLKGRIEGTEPNRNVWLPAVMYAIFLFVKGGACIGWLRKWLWLPVEQYSYDALSTASHAHLMSLSSDFHDSKTSSDLVQAVSGGRSVAELLETICFQVIPMFIDMTVAFAYLWALFGPYMGFIMVTTVISYLYTTTKLVAVRSGKRRDYVTVYRREYTIGQTSLDGWNTASLFNMIPYERNRYASAVKEHMRAKGVYELSSQAIGAAQSLVMTGGLLGALFLGVYQVVYEGQTIGKFTTLLVYWVQLQAPLVFFSNMYRSISYSLMDAERLLELFQTKPTITDLPSAKPLKLGKGEVTFDEVSFAYDDRKPTLKGVSFTVPAGKTVAIVGETGGGKSTILKLINRFYDVKSGKILIDGQDLRDVTVGSLRGNIGVVPQDPALFNDSIINNVRYARIDATDKEVYDACKAAAVHDKIISLPDGYNSKVGDRGVKVSGGEKQRIAIARAMLKKPEIMLLDEATSAVDTETEHLIQKGLRSLCEGRTTFIVAHRLSTIMRADRIIVVMNGEIVESGTHDELIQANGKYLGLWSKQVYVKGADKSDRSHSRNREVDEMVNDLNPTLQEAELAKIMKTRTHEESSSHEDDQQVTKDDEQSPLDPANIGEPGTSEGDGAALESHKVEGSMLRSGGPEFVPLPVTPKPDEFNASQYDVKATAQKQRQLMKQLVKQEKEQQKQQLRPQSSGSRNFRRPFRRHDGADDQLADSNKNGAEVSTGVKQTQISRDAEVARRKLTKSEPAKLEETSLDGSQDLKVAGAGFCAGLLVLQTSGQRRASAPTDLPRGKSHQSRRRQNRGRSRNWRLKSRINNEGTDLGSGSGTTANNTNNATATPPISTTHEGV